MVHQVAPGEALLRLFEETDDARVLLTEDGTLVLVNRRCEEMYGWSREDLVEESAEKLVPEHLRPDYERLLNLMFGSSDGRTMRVNLRGLHHDGTQFPVRLTARVIDLGQQDSLLSVIIRPRTDDGSDTGFRDLLEAVSDGNVIVDAHGRIVMANARVVELFGYAEDELVDQSVEMLVPDGVRTAHEVLRGGFTGLARRHTMGQGNRVIARRKDGSTFPVRVLLSTVGTEDEVLVSAAIRDLSELEELERANDRAKDRFLATVSHELRTPLTTIIGSAELLVDDLDDVADPALRDRLARYAAMIVRGARRELALVEDLLALTSLESGVARSREGVCDLHVVAAESAEGVADRARAARVRISTPDLDEHPVLVVGDETWLTRAVNCLVGNAVKFTPAGGEVVLEAGVTGDVAWLEVCDTGPGIPPGDEEKVFERLYRGPQAIAAEKPGAGLGLTISRTIVASLGGTLVAVPTEGGARFRMELPAARD